MRKVAGVFLALILVCGGFASFVSAQTDTKSTVTVWCWDPSFNIYAMNEAAKVYAQFNPNVTINVVETPWDDVQTKLTTAVLAGQLDTLPDILLMQDNAAVKNVTNFPGTFVDLTESGIDFSQFAEYKVALTTVDGRNYAVPFDNGTTINALRADILEQAGYTVDDFRDITWSRYIEMGKDILEKTGKPLASTVAGQPDFLMLMLQSAGTWMFDDEGDVFIKDNAVLREVISNYVEMVKSGVVVEVNDWDQYISTFVTGTVAGTINGCWIIASITSQPAHEGLWRITNIPRLDNVPGATNYSNQGGSSWMVLESSKNKDVAIDFLAKTFAGSVEFYETILPSSGALATYLPAGQSEVYNEPHEFFGGQRIYAEIVEYASQVPQVKYGVYNYEARDAIGTAITQIISGASMDAALIQAEETVRFLMWQ